MSDLFHIDVPDAYIRQVFDVMNYARWHQYQVLTKRSERVLVLSDVLPWAPQIWMGVSVENEKYADRIEELRKTRAHVKFLSLEPLLGPLKNLNFQGIDWAIAGRESGPGARAVDHAWVSDLRDQCLKMNVPFFLKQWGEFTRRRPAAHWMGERGIKCLPRLLSQFFNTAPSSPQTPPKAAPIPDSFTSLVLPMPFPARNCYSWRAMSYKAALFFITFLFTPEVDAQLDKIIGGLGNRNNPGDAKTASGLKEALQIGTDHAVDFTGTRDGFFKNDAIKILLPAKLRTAEKGLRMAGMSAKLDEFELSMNRAAEKAAPAARSIFKDALMAMTFDDARKILTGGDTSATEYFKSKTSDKLTSVFRPTVEATMADTGVVTQYKQLSAGGLSSLPFGKTANFDITDYVVGKALDGLFYMVGQEEKKIRTNPAAQITPLLKEVFGKR